jgi:anti-sigma factor RsiW
MNATPTPAPEIERLMLDALDGVLDESGRKALDTYLAQHPAERALFARMQGVDIALQAAPVVSAPRAFSAHVMSAVAQTRMAQPPLKAAQIAFLILAAGVLVVLAALLALALYTQLSPAFPQAELSAAYVFLRSLIDIGASVFTAAASFARAIFSQPVAWLVTAGLAVIVAVWLRVMAAVMLTGWASAHSRLIVLA